MATNSFLRTVCSFRSLFVLHPRTCHEHVLVQFSEHIFTNLSVRERKACWIWRTLNNGAFLLLTGTVGVGDVRVIYNDQHITSRNNARELVTSFGNAAGGFSSSQSFLFFIKLDVIYGWRVVVFDKKRNSLPNPFAPNVTHNSRMSVLFFFRKKQSLTF